MYQINCLNPIADVGLKNFSDKYQITADVQEADGILVRSKQKEFPVTEKADRESHGIGLMNMKRTAERYQGAMDYKVKGKVFLLSVMMKNEKPPE